MANFLTNLARRSFTPVSGIRPRLASLFEPASAVPGTLNGPGESNSPIEATNFQEAEVETGSGEEEPESNSSSASPVRRRSGKKSSVQGTHAAAEDDATFDDTVEAEPDLQRSTPVRSQRRLSPARSNKTMDAAGPEESLLVEVPGAKPTVIMPSQTESGILAPAPAMARRDDLSIENERPAPSPSRTMVVGQVPVRERLNPRSEENAVPAFADFANRSSVAPPLLIPNVARARKRPGRTLEDPRRESEPSIQVTIGRVEVRAEVSNHATSRAERTSSPVMSLEEYLRRRNKRGVE